MENEEPRPVKSINRRCLEIKPYNCLIWGKRAGKENLRSPEEKGISAFVTALGTRGACNNFDKSANDDAFDFNNNTLKNNEVSIKWHPSCYSIFINSKNLSLFKDNQLNEEGTSPLNDTDGTSAHSQKPLINLKDACIFCGYIKHNTDKS